MSLLLCAEGINWASPRLKSFVVWLDSKYKDPLVVSTNSTSPWKSTEFTPEIVYLSPYGCERVSMPVVTGISDVDEIGKDAGWAPV